MSNTFHWDGRDDGTAVNHKRIFQVINQSESTEYSLIGFGSDEGVQRNKGRIGAAEAPNAIRKQLANLPVHQTISIADRGDVICQHGLLEEAQAVLADHVAQALEQGEKPIVLGGGHEVAYGSFSGLFQYLKAHEPDKNIGIINFDAHFDLRQADQASSGTPFLQAAQKSKEQGKSFHYLCIGVAKHSNTQVLFETADRLNAAYILDRDVQVTQLESLKQKIQSFIDQVDYLYVTIDLDVFASSIAPGVSAPAVKGIDLAVFDPLIQFIKDSGKIRVFDVAECNPKFDLDNKTAKLAAYIIFNYIFD
ncbi:formimidoylglutamase [Acinetobacter sichuanensis]|uniref:Formimidoylglutamase n=1 Tax=Acinetobacter sichuanensis TaxID=2136183 RepID=A0A371YLA8_9GAMM|nr:formimidoylglutamase [Acinetobacter sichuanensis]RFC82267.1 formimidoylglutamase [Acinetobacter sichuanensis]